MKNEFYIKEAKKKARLITEDIRTLQEKHAPIKDLIPQHVMSLLKKGTDISSDNEAMLDYMAVFLQAGYTSKYPYHGIDFMKSFHEIEDLAKRVEANPESYQAEVKKLFSLCRPLVQSMCISYEDQLLPITKKQWEIFEEKPTKANLVDLAYSLMEEGSAIREIPGSKDVASILMHAAGLIKRDQLTKWGIKDIERN